MAVAANLEKQTVMRDAVAIGAAHHDGRRAVIRRVVFRMTAMGRVCVSSVRRSFVNGMRKMETTLIPIDCIHAAMPR